MAKSLEEVFAEKPHARLRIYAYSIQDDHHQNIIKVGQTTQGAKKRVGQQLKTAGIKNFTIELDESAERADGSVITDHEVRSRLKAKGFDNPQLEWMSCSVDDVRTAITECVRG